MITVSRYHSSCSVSFFFLLPFLSIPQSEHSGTSLNITMTWQAMSHNDDVMIHRLYLGLPELLDRYQSSRARSERDKWKKRNDMCSRHVKLRFLVGTKWRKRQGVCNDEEQESETPHWSPWSHFFPSSLHPTPLVRRGPLEDKKPPIKSRFTDWGSREEGGDVLDHWANLQPLVFLVEELIRFLKRVVWGIPKNETYKTCNVQYRDFFWRLYCVTITLMWKKTFFINVSMSFILFS